MTSKDPDNISLYIDRAPQMAPIGRLFDGPAPLLATGRFVCILPAAAPIGRAFDFGFALIRLGSLRLSAKIEWVMHVGSTRG